jgi:hypothetical protein
VQLVQARVAAGAGDHPAAQAAFEAGLAAAEAAGTPYERAEVLRAYGAFLGASTSSPVPPAAELLAEAAAILGHLRGSAVAAGPAIANEQELGLL